MSNIFKVTVDNTYNFEVNKEDILNLDAFPASNSKFHILQQNTPYEAEIIEINFNDKSYKIKVNNNIYNVNIFNDLDLLIKEMGFNAKATNHVNSIKSPMPGLILDVSVKVGQEVKEDDALLILEAMKMENIITSPRDGIIKAITINKGDAVEKNQLLIEFE